MAETIVCKAAVAWGPNQPLKIEQVKVRCRDRPDPLKASYTDVIFCANRLRRRKRARSVSRYVVG
jgi:hypothetical protein